MADMFPFLSKYINKKNKKMTGYSTMVKSSQHYFFSLILVHIIVRSIVCIVQYKYIKYMI